MKRAQIQSGESIAVIIIVFIMIVVGIAFFYGNRTNEIQDQAERAKSLDAVAVALRVQALNEVKCIRSSSTTNTCLDYERVKAMSEILSNEFGEEYAYYYNIFRDSRITIRTVYPEEEEIIMYDYNGNKNSSSTVFMPISVLDPVTENSFLGVLEVKTFS